MQRISYLDGLRGIAALIVVLSHFIYAFYPALETGSIFETHTQNQMELWVASGPFNILYSGNLAVCLFFVLSGFVLTHGFFKKNDYELIVSLAVRRYFRLQIPIFFAILLTYAMMKCSLFCNQQIVPITQSTWWLAKCWDFDPNFIEVLKQAFFYVLFDPTNSRVLYNGVMWTMPYEFVGSFLVFGSAVLLAGKRYRFYAYALLALLSINSYFLAFILGMILADLYTEEGSECNRFEGRWSNTLVLALGLFCGSYPAVVVPGTFYHTITCPIIKHNESFYHIVGSFFILLFILNSAGFQKILSMRFPQFLGRISFSMYLLHCLFIGSTASYLFRLLLVYVDYFPAFIITVVVNLLVIFGASIAMNRYVDQCGLRFSKRVYEYISMKRAKPKKAAV